MPALGTGISGAPLPRTMAIGGSSCAHRENQESLERDLIIAGGFRKFFTRAKV